MAQGTILHPPNIILLILIIFYASNYIQKIYFFSLEYSIVNLIVSCIELQYSKKSFNSCCDPVNLPNVIDKSEPNLWTFRMGIYEFSLCDPQTDSHMWVLTWLPWLCNSSEQNILH